MRSLHSLWKFIWDVYFYVTLISNLSHHALNTNLGQPVRFSDCNHSVIPSTWVEFMSNPSQSTMNWSNNNPNQGSFALIHSLHVLPCVPRTGHMQAVGGKPHWKKVSWATDSHSIGQRQRARMDWINNGFSFFESGYRLVQEAHCAPWLIHAEQPQNVSVEL